MSARTVVGNNKDGQLLILQVDGRTDHRGYIYQMSVYGGLGGVGQGYFFPQSSGVLHFKLFLPETLHICNLGLHHHHHHYHDPFLCHFCSFKHIK